jgi:hypothetical protein
MGAVNKIVKEGVDLVGGAKKMENIIAEKKAQQTAKEVSKGQWMKEEAAARRAADAQKQKLADEAIDAGLEKGGYKETTRSINGENGPTDVSGYTDPNGNFIQRDDARKLYANDEAKRVEAEAIGGTAYGRKQSQTAGANQTSSSAMDDAINNKSGDKVKAQMANRVDKGYAQRQATMEKAINGGEAEMDKLGKQWGVEGKADKAALSNNLDSWKSGQFKAGPTTMDAAWAYKVPQKVGGLGAGAWLVSNMSSSKGQMSNSALYGQSTPYQ